MPIFLVERIDTISWFEFDKAVVRAGSEKEALMICCNELVEEGQPKFQSHNSKITRVEELGDSKIILSSNVGG